MINRFTDFWFSPVEETQYTVLRASFAGLSIVQWFFLWPIREMFFSRNGMISGFDAGDPGLFPSLFEGSFSETTVTLLFCFALIVMIVCFLGFLSRLTVILLAYWHYSLGFDMSPAISGYDMILKAVAFVLIISPLGKSLIGKRETKRVPAYGLYLIRWQVLIIYIATVWCKLPSPYWRNGQMISYFMMSVYSLYPSAWFAHAEKLSVLFTYGTLASEVAIPFLLFSKSLRWLGVVLGIFLHGGIAVTSNVWIFSLTMWMMFAAFVSAKDLKEWSEKARGWIRG